EYVSAFWNPVFKALNLIDQKRNEIVHWTTLVSIGDAVGVSLVPPNIYDLLADQPAQPWDIARLGAYSDECSFYLRLINMFGFWTFSEMKVADIDAQRKTWLDIFQQAPVYPPPDNHPLSPNYVEP
ncbi:MAG: hypothetical protein J0H65_09060, partial [Rhizobiales bacterium]|nr:hypothetical protein [Hyphomicrobiales bacterium]